MKRLLATPLLLLVASQVQGSSDHQSGATSGFYAGLSGGASWMRNNQVNQRILQGIVRASSEEHTQETSGVGLFTIGYQHTTDFLFASLEGFGGLSHFQNRSNLRRFTNRFNAPENVVQFRWKRQALFGGAIRLGKRLNHVSPYLKLGAQWHETNLYYQTRIPRFQSQYRNHRRITPSFLLGVGLNKPITNQLSFRIEYTGAFSPSVQKTFQAPFVVRNTGQVFPNTVIQRLKSPDSQTVTLGLFWHL